MEIQFCTLEECAEATGTVVVVDVVRAFSTAACAFGAGAEQIYIAGSVEESAQITARLASRLGQGASKVRRMGEVGGLPIEGFDLWNSPSQVLSLDLRGSLLVQRTSAGTQGIVRARNAEKILASSFNVAGATARAIQACPQAPVTFVITGTRGADARFGAEDRACAEYIAGLLRGEPPDGSLAHDWVQEFITLHRIMDLEEPLRSQFLADLDICQEIDRFPFAMQAVDAPDAIRLEKI